MVTIKRKRKKHNNSCIYSQRGFLVVLTLLIITITTMVHIGIYQMHHEFELEWNSSIHHYSKNSDMDMTLLLRHNTNTNNRNHHVNPPPPNYNTDKPPIAMMMSDYHHRFERYPTDVFIFPRIQDMDNAKAKTWGEYNHLILDGIEKSMYLSATDSPLADVWVVELMRISSDGLYCDMLLDVVKLIRNYRMDGWHLILLDYTDYGDWGRDGEECTYDTFDGYSTNCTNLLAEVVGADNVTLSTRSHAYNRTYTCFYRDRNCHGCQLLDDSELHYCYSDDAPFQERIGHIFDFRKRNISQYVSGNSVKKAFYPVRSDLLEKINNRMRNQTRDPVDMNRSIDVIHFWDVNITDPFANLRSRVSEAILSLRTHTDLSVLATQYGHRSSTGRNNVADEYVTKLLSSKMVVVCQRDEWEDHYRLMEALISGALVFTDPMVYLPSGYEDGTNIIVFYSINELKEKVLYFALNDHLRISIARKGRELALSRHRSFHYMEDYIFNDGRALSSPFLERYDETVPKVVY